MIEIPTGAMSALIFAAVFVLVALGGWLGSRAAKAESTPRKPFVLRIEHTHTITPHSIALLGDAIDAATQLTPETVGLLAEMFDQAIADYHTRAADAMQNVPMAKELVTPPQPEERIAHDLKRASVVLRGADELMRAATAAGQHLSRQEAMRQAASMVFGAFDSDD